MKISRRFIANMVMFLCMFVCWFIFIGGLIIRPHRSATYMRQYRRSSGVCRSVCLSRSWALQNGWTDRAAVWDAKSGGSRKTCIVYGHHIGATWRIRLSRPCATAMRPYVKLFSPLVNIVVIRPHRGTIARCNLLLQIEWRGVCRSVCPVLASISFQYFSVRTKFN